MGELIGFGNLKVGKDTAIFNMTTARDCPSKKLGLCQICDKCYAKKAERLYPTVLPYRERQNEFWGNTDYLNFSSYLFALVAKKKVKVNYLRFSESGDFRCQTDVQKLSDIADTLKGIVKVYVYTARKDLDFSNLSGNLVVNGSGFMVDNNFYVYRNESEIIDKNVLCKGDCLKCDLCKVSRGLNIGIKLH